MQTNTELEDSDEPVDEDDDEFGSIYDPKSEFKKPLLAQEAIRTCRESRSKEMKNGFWNTRIDKQGNAVRVWQEDQRKVYINAVIAVESLLAAECSQDAKYKKAMEQIEKDIKALYEKYAYNIFEFNQKNAGWTKTDIKIMPQIDEELLVPSSHDPRVLVNVEGGWNSKVNAYYDELVLVYDRMFKEIMLVINRINDFGQKFTE